MEKTVERKRRNLIQTQARIVAAAFDLFSSQGYAKTSIRDIASKADVAVSLVVRYFETKSALFEKALIDSLYREGFMIDDRINFGDKTARLLAEDKNARITAIMVLSIADPESRDIACEVTRNVVMKELAAWLGPPDPIGRAFHMMTLMNGFMIQAHHLMNGPIPETSICRLARSLQAIVDEGETSERTLDAT